FNVEGREPSGTIPAAKYEEFRQEMTERFEALVDDRGRRMRTRVFRPEAIYRSVKNVAPDLIVYFDDLWWRSIGAVGYDSLHVQENDTGPDECNPPQFGVFTLPAPGLPRRGETEGMHILDVAPTLLDLLGRPVPASMQGRSLLKR